MPRKRLNASFYIVPAVLIFLLPAMILSLPTRWAILAFIACLFVCLALLTHNVRRLLLAAILLDIPFQLDIYLGHQASLIEFGGISGWNISVTTIALFFLYAMWFIETARGVRGREFTLARCGLPLSAFVGFSMLSMAVARNPQRSLMAIFLLLQMLLLYNYIVATTKTRKDVLYILAVLLLGVALESVIMICLGTVEGPTKASMNWGSRAGGTFGNPNVAGGYLSIMLAPAMGLMLVGINKYYKRLGTITLCLGVIAISFTLSRGSWTAFTVSGLIFITISWSRGWMSLKLPVILFAVVAVLLFLYQEVYVVRFTGESDVRSAIGRIPLMKLAMNIIRENLLFGVGINNFTVVMREYVTYELRDMWLYVVHNKYLLVWAETGIGGLLAYLWFFISTIGKGWKCWRLQDPLLAPLALGITAAIIGRMIHMHVDVFENRALIQSLWLNSALVVAMYNILQVELTENKKTYHEKNSQG